MKQQVDFKTLTLIKNYNKRQMTAFLSNLYDSAYQDGYNDCKNESGQEIDFELLKIAIKATEGIGDVLYKRLVDTIDRLCFSKED